MNGTKAEDIKFVSRWWMFTHTGAEDKAQKEIDSTIAFLERVINVKGGELSELSKEACLLHSAKRQLKSGS